MQFKATLEWKRNGQDFPGQRYSRAHTWPFDGGAVVSASSSPLAKWRRRHRSPQVSKSLDRPARRRLSRNNGDQADASLGS